MEYSHLHKLIITVLLIPQILLSVRGTAFADDFSLKDRPETLAPMLKITYESLNSIFKAAISQLLRLPEQVKLRSPLTDLIGKSAEFQRLCNGLELSNSSKNAVSQGVRYIRIDDSDSFSRDIEIPKDEAIVLGSPGYGYCRAGVISWVKDGKRFIYIIHDAWKHLYRYIDHKIKYLKEEKAEDIKIVIHGSFDELTARRTLNPLFMNIQHIFYFKDHEKGQNTAIALLKLHLADKLKISQDNIALDIKEDDKTLNIDRTTVVVTAQGVAIRYPKDSSKDRFVLWAEPSLSLRDSRGSIVPSDREIRYNLKNYNVLTKYFLGVRIEDIKKGWVPFTGIETAI